MAVETATTIAGLNAAWPLGTDSKSEGDNHIRLVKTVMQADAVRKGGDTMTGTLTVNPGNVICSVGVIEATAGKVRSNQFFESLATSAILGTTGAGTCYLRPNGIASATGQFVVDNTGNATSTGFVTALQNFQSSTSNITLSTTGAGTCYLRPNGAGSSSGQFSVDASGNVISTGSVTANQSFVSSTSSLVLAATGSGGVWLRPNGAAVTTGQVTIDTTGLLTVNQNIQAATANLVLGTTGAGSIIIRPNGVGSTTGQGFIDSAGNLTIAGPTGTKASGTTWANPSDARLKQVLGPYDGGLEEIIQLNPVVYTLLAHPEAGEQIGVIGQEIEQVMPETIKLVEGEIVRDGETITVPDLRQFDANAITFALINAVKELSARLEALEAAGG